MDGLLIYTVDLYTIFTNEILHKYGKPSLPWTLKAQLQGRTGPSAYTLFQSWAQLPLTPEEFFVEQGALQRKYFPTCRPMPGVPELLETVRKAGVHMALATSSQTKNFYLKTTHLPELFNYFTEELRVTGDAPRVAPGKGKPNPDIFLAALESVNVGCRARREREVKPEECLVFEDSVPGVEAGRRAGMRIVWVPHPELFGVMENRVDEVLAGKGEQKVNGEENSESMVNGVHKNTETGLKGWPSHTADGWGELMMTLEGFDIHQYGANVAH